MTLKAIHHAGLVIRDLDRSIYFYHDILGLPFANEPTPWFSGPQLETGVGVPGAVLRQVSLWVGEHSTLELIEYQNRPASSTSPVPNNFMGAAHVCLLVDDIQAKKADLEGKGVTFYSDVNVVDEGSAGRLAMVLFQRPGRSRVRARRDRLLPQGRTRGGGAGLPADAAQPSGDRGKARLTSGGRALSRSRSHATIAIRFALLLRRT